ncbi:hypothetical protein C0J52_04838 [Blattella germanica]|nr:hypothetical protein C0J52_04838 [Blattella germanica]
MRLPLVLSLALLIVSEVSSHNLGRKPCNCGLKSGGTDVCGCDNTVVRPPLPPPPQKIGLPSKEDLLEKLGNLLPGKKVVKKVVIEEPTYYVEKVEVPYAYRFYPQKYVDIFDKYELDEDEKSIKIPIDAVSLTLAYEKSKQKGIDVKEESLNFGPRIIPKEDVVKAYKDVPEHGLLNFDKRVIELKYPGGKTKLIPYEDEEEYDIFHKGLTYEDIGYFQEGSLKDHKCIYDYKPSVSVEEVFPYKVKPYILPKPKKEVKEWGLFLGSKEYDDEYIGEDSSEEWVEWKVVPTKTGPGKDLLQCDEFVDKYYKRKY